MYQRYAAKYLPPEKVLSQAEILTRFRRAYSAPWAQSTIRYVDDGRPFWRFIVQVMIQDGSVCNGCHEQVPEW